MTSGFFGSSYGLQLNCTACGSRMSSISLPLPRSSINPLM